MSNQEGLEGGPPERPDAKRIEVSMFKGMEQPLIELQDGDDVWVRLEGEEENLPPEELEKLRRRIAISLKRIRFDLHNQSYGMISASTGCASNPGGPGC